MAHKVDECVQDALTGLVIEVAGSSPSGILESLVEGTKDRCPNPQGSRRTTGLSTFDRYDDDEAYTFGHVAAATRTAAAIASEQPLATKSNS
jgi:hypothetical protein